MADSDLQYESAVSRRNAWAGRSIGAALHHGERMSASGDRTHFRIAIIGSGFGGLGAAIRLKQQGITDFVVLERAEDVGGTWRDNSYPGCACDVQSHVYSFSFAPHPDWTRLFAPQAEIRAYLEHCAARFGIEPHLRFNETLERATFDEPSQRWLLRFSTGRR